VPFLNSLKGVALGDHPDEIGWVDFYSDSNKTNQQLYLLSFYYVFTTMSTVGYGDITPHLYMEYVFSLWNMFVGTIVFGAPAPAPPRRCRRPAHELSLPPVLASNPYHRRGCAGG
jgi:hypothetical protein